MNMITRATLLEAIRKKPLELVRCDKCLKPSIVFEFRDGKFGKRNECECSEKNPWIWSSVNVLDFYINPKNGWGEDLYRFIESAELKVPVLMCISCDFITDRVTMDYCGCCGGELESGHETEDGEYVRDSA